MCQEWSMNLSPGDKCLSEKKKNNNSICLGQGGKRSQKGESYQLTFLKCFSPFPDDKF